MESADPNSQSTSPVVSSSTTSTTTMTTSTTTTTIPTTTTQVGWSPPKAKIKSTSILSSSDLSSSSSTSATTIHSQSYKEELEKFEKSLENKAAELLHSVSDPVVDSVFHDDHDHGHGHGRRRGHSHGEGRVHSSSDSNHSEDEDEEDGEREKKLGRDYMMEYDHLTSEPDEPCGSSGTGTKTFSPTTTSIGLQMKSLRGRFDYNRLLLKRLTPNNNNNNATTDSPDHPTDLSSQPSPPLNAICIPDRDRDRDQSVQQASLLPLPSFESPSFSSPLLPPTEEDYSGSPVPGIHGGAFVNGRFRPDPPVPRLDGMGRERKGSVDFDEVWEAGEGLRRWGDEGDDEVPEVLRRGLTMVKISNKKMAKRMVRIAPEEGRILWESKKKGVVNIENIRELRFGSDARAIMDQFGKILGPAYSTFEPLWTSIIYTVAGKFSALHLVASNAGEFEMWKGSLLRLVDQRRELMGGLSQMRKRQRIWLRQYWRQANCQERERGRGQERDKERDKSKDKVGGIGGNLKGEKDGECEREGEGGQEEEEEMVNFEEVETLCRRLNIGASKEDLKANFERADVKRLGKLNFADFQVFVKLLKRRTELENIFMRFSEGQDLLSRQQFVDFVRNTQKSSLEDSVLVTLYRKFSDAERNAMTIEGFTSFLMSSDNAAFSEKHTRVCQDMTRPLCDYYISSSHNTYLVGNQLRGESTVEGYIRALQQGCRCVELDVWDGSESPVVYHGRTLTSRLPVKDILVAVAKYAFIASPYPVILSLEVHCKLEQQDMLADLLRGVFGKSLVDRRMDGVEDGCLPSPENLKYRILIKAKNRDLIPDKNTKLSELVQEHEACTTTESEFTPDSSAGSDSEFRRALRRPFRRLRGRSETEATGPTPDQRPCRSASTERITVDLSSYAAYSPPTPRASATPSSSTIPSLAPADRRTASNSSGSGESNSSMNAIAPAPASGGAITLEDYVMVSSPPTLYPTTTSSSISGSGSIKSTSSARSNNPKPRTSSSLSSLLVYTVGIKSRGINKKETYAIEHVISLSENKANKMLKEEDLGAALLSHNRNHLVRVYPAGTRFNSSNFTPVRYWSVGCQMVAINWQTFDLGAEINAAFFTRNGRKGYVLKPHFLCAKGKEKDRDVLSNPKKFKLDISIISAQQLPRSREKEEARSAKADDEGSNVHVLNPYVEVSLIGPCTNLKDIPKKRCKTVWGNGFSPIWDESTSFPFEVPDGTLELVFLRFEVMDNEIGGQDKSLARFCVCLKDLQSGYRHLPLYDHLGQQYLFSSIFIKSYVSAVD